MLGTEADTTATAGGCNGYAETFPLCVVLVSEAAVQFLPARVIYATQLKVWGVG